MNLHSGCLSPPLQNTLLWGLSHSMKWRMKFVDFNTGFQNFKPVKSLMCILEFHFYGEMTANVPYLECPLSEVPLYNAIFMLAMYKPAQSIIGRGIDHVSDQPPSFH